MNELKYRVFWFNLFLMNNRAIGTSIFEEKVLASRFVCFVTEFNDLDSLENILSSFKKEYPKADHYPYAYILDGLSKSSDDGEPSGTAGRQFLDLLNKENMDHCLLIVARYFGGSKLGVGRLTRTFVETAKGALDLIKKGKVTQYKQSRVTLSYSDYELLKKNSLKNNIILSEVEFLDNVSVTLSLEKDKEFNEKDLGISFKEIIELEDKEIVKEVK